MAEDKRMSLWGIGPIYTSISFPLVLIAILIHYLTFPRFYLPGISLTAILFIAIPLITLGLLLWVSAGIQIDKYIINGILADKGVYGIVRNPIYAGILFVATGGLLLFRSLIMLPVPILMYFLLKLLLISEEKVLTEYFGEAFLSYRQRVNSIIPNLKCLGAVFFISKKRER